MFCGGGDDEEPAVEMVREPAVEMVREKEELAVEEKDRRWGGDSSMERTRSAVEKEIRWWRW
ncbi:unnamed protein product [Arabis nemorensis]|uniref:Uncharacterized protein n=1 Tax=Arabis nemorensis TaxID=586526 RepID=A0A565C9U9_9BRAS|nr:unnamed protein product [Arabis nemorensis]